MIFVEKVFADEIPRCDVCDNYVKPGDCCSGFESQASFHVQFQLQTLCSLVKLCQIALQYSLQRF